MKVVALAGGTGSAKLLRGLQGLSVRLTAVVNVGDNAWMYGVYVCPDVDVATYALAGIASRATGWGIEGDSFEALDELAKLGEETWFRLGDRDLAVCLLRTQMLREGATLTEATDRIRRGLGVKSRVLPATDSGVETWIATSKGEMHLQEFWVKEKGEPRVKGVSYRGARTADATPQVRSAILSADRVVVCPANPVTSIGPMLALRGFAGLLSETSARVVAVSPMVGRAPISGPAGKFMRAMGMVPDSSAVARLYSKFLDCMLISEQDRAMKSSIESLGLRCVTSDTMMAGPADEARLAAEALEI